MLFNVPTDAQYYKIVDKSKHLKTVTFAPDMFRFTQEPSSGSSPVISQNYKSGLLLFSSV
jgi:hypothetical protein